MNCNQIYKLLVAVIKNQLAVAGRCCTNKQSLLRCANKQHIKNMDEHGQQITRAVRTPNGSHLLEFPYGSYTVCVGINNKKIGN